MQKGYTCPSIVYWLHMLLHIFLERNVRLFEVTKLYRTTEEYPFLAIYPVDNRSVNIKDTSFLTMYVQTLTNLKQISLRGTCHEKQSRNQITNSAKVLRIN